MQQPIVRAIDFLASDSLACSSSSTDPFDIGMFYLMLAGFVVGSAIVVFAFSLLVKACQYRLCSGKNHQHQPQFQELKQPYSSNWNSNSLNSSKPGTPLHYSSNSSSTPIGKKSRKINKKRSATHRHLSLKHWLEALKLNSAVAITNQQRLANRLRQEGYRKEEEYEQDRQAMPARSASSGFLQSKVAVSSDSMFVALSSQLRRINHGDFAPADIRQRAVAWLRANRRWCSLDLTNFVGGRDWNDFCDTMQQGGTNPLLLIAVSEVFDCRMTIYTDTEGDYYAVTIDRQEYMSVSQASSSLNKVQQQQQQQQLQQQLQQLQPSTSNSNLNDNDSVALSHTNDASPQVLLEGKGVGRSEMHLRLWQEDNVFGSLLPANDVSKPDDDKRKARPKRHKRQRRDTDMYRREPGMRVRERPTARVANIAVQLLIGISGFWWLLWIFVWGMNFVNFWGGIEYVLFVIAELLNYVFGIVYFLNFCYPIQRRWRSLDSLLPRFNISPVVNALIFHYTEDIDDTRRTVNGCLRVDTMGRQIKFNIFICDDGFWKKIVTPDDKSKPAAPAAASTSWWSKTMASMIKCCDCFGCFTRTSERAPLLSPQAAPPPPSAPAAATGVQSPVAAAAAAASSDDEVHIDPSTQVPPPPTNGIHSMSERQVLDWVAQHHKLEPSDIGRAMIEGLREEMADYFLAVHKRVVDVGYTCQLTTKMIRPDCAVATVRYTFKPSQEMHEPYPTLHLVARIKPPKHHHKAGNANNALFNERLDGKYALFLDNDMKPKPDLLLRMLPWFYNYIDSRAEYQHNRSVAFVQAPQHFTWETVGPEDILCGRNSIFFSAIQRGRDGFDSCAFAGTNAIFRIPALRAVQGLPYESLTEDALLGMNLLDAGYTSVYCEDKLVVGRAPTTVAAAMQQRKRWCKV
jgi:cellulose synthase/poly-beta-1,6-N-acetylglucosamine synthase-like glycosyltransferase